MTFPLYPTKSTAASSAAKLPTFSKAPINTKMVSSQANNLRAHYVSRPPSNAVIASYLISNAYLRRRSSISSSLRPSATCVRTKVR